MIKRSQTKRGNKSGKFSSEREDLIKFAKENTDLDNAKEFYFHDERELTAYRNLLYSVNVKLKSLNLHPLASEKVLDENDREMIIFFCTELNAKEVTA